MSSAMKSQPIRNVLTRPWSLCVLAMVQCVVLSGGSCGGDAPDTDRDGIADLADNCVAVANPDQADGNGNGVGDACESSPGASTQTAASLEQDLASASVAGTSLTQMIDAGTPPAAALQSLVQTLWADPQVSDVRQGDAPDNIWVAYRSGLVHGFAVIDEAEEEDALAMLPEVPTAAPAARVSEALPPRSGDRAFAADSKPSLLRLQQSSGGNNYNIPGNAKAVLANSLTVSQPLQNTTLAIQPMLKARGYDAPCVAADLALFKRLTEFSVIYIEAHGWASPWTTPQDIFGGGKDPTCQRKGGTMVLATTTLVRDEDFRRNDEGTSVYGEDVVCGRLRVVTVAVRRENAPASSARVYAVTPNFVRKYAVGRFPSRTLFCLSSCRGQYDLDFSSKEWADLLNEKCDDGFLVGWTNKVHYAVSAQAFLNLFQIMTGSNEQFTLKSKRSGKTYYLLERNLPPFCAQDLSTAWYTLTQAKYANAKGDFTQDPLTGAQLTWDWPPAVLSGTLPFFQLMLAPDLLRLMPGGAGEPRAFLTAMCPPETMLRVGDQQVSVGEWQVSVYRPLLPTTASGTMYLELNGRKGPAHDLLLWSPRFTVNGTGPHGMVYTITYNPRVRATPTAYPNRHADRVWSSATGTHFQTRIDPQGSTVQWSVSGQAIEGQNEFIYSGSGLQPLSPAGDFLSDDGKTATFTLTSDIDLSYTVTVRDLQDNSTSSYTENLVSDFNIDSMSLGSDWTVQAGSAPYSGSQTPGTISWSSFSPTPRFDPVNTRQ